MENRIYLMDLFDIYGSLLTEKQQEFFEEYYFNNLTLSELSENYEVSRTAIHSSIKETEQKLKYYESKLEIYRKRKELMEVIEELSKEQKDKIQKIMG